MKKVVFSVLTALAVSTAVPAFAADMPVKAYKAPAPAPSPWDIAFGTAFTTDYMLRGISQSNHQAAVQGYTELQYKPADWIQLYANLWGSSLHTGFANAEFDFSGGARLSYGNFGLDLGYVYYAYPGGVPGVNSFGEFYAKPSYKLTPWLTIGGSIVGGGDFNGVGEEAYFYTGNAAITLPWTFPYGITSVVSGEVGRQHYASIIGNTDYTFWNAGIAFTYKVITLDLRYYGANIDQTSAPQCGAIGTTNACSDTFVATLKFDTTLSALK